MAGLNAATGMISRAADLAVYVENLRSTSYS